MVSRIERSAGVAARKDGARPTRMSVPQKRARNVRRLRLEIMISLRFEWVSSRPFQSAFSIPHSSPPVKGFSRGGKEEEGSRQKAWGRPPDTAKGGIGET